MIYLVCGVSSVGKSTFLCSKKVETIINDFKSRDVHFASEVKKDDSILLKSNIVLHYNIMNKFRLDTLSNKTYDYSFDELIDKMLLLNVSFRVILLVTSYKEIVKRVEQREFIEPNFEMEASSMQYDSKLHKHLYENIDLEKLYEAFYEKIIHLHMPIEIIDTSTKEYKSILNLSDMLKKINQKGLL